MASDWAAHSASERGALIKYYLDGNTAPAAKTAELATAAILLQGYQVGGNYNVNHHPTAAEVLALKIKIIQLYPYILDGLFQKVSPSITNESLASLVTDSALALATNAGLLGAAQQLRLEAGAGFSVGTEDQETGLAYKANVRDLEEKAIKNPDQYVTDSNTDLKKIDEQALAVFKLSYAKYYSEYKLPSKEAKEKAISDMNVYKKLLIDQHNILYKNRDYETASKKIFKSS